MCSGQMAPDQPKPAEKTVQAKGELPVSSGIQNAELLSRDHSQPLAPHRLTSAFANVSKETGSLHSLNTSESEVRIPENFARAVLAQLELAACRQIKSWGDHFEQKETQHLNNSVLRLSTLQDTLMTAVDLASSYVSKCKAFDLQALFDSCTMQFPSESRRNARV